MTVQAGCALVCATMMLTLGAAQTATALELEPAAALSAIAPDQVASGDLDGDRRPELAVAASAQRVLVFRQTGARTFAAPVAATTASVPYQPQIADVRGDAKPELVVVRNGAIDVFAPQPGLVFAAPVQSVPITDGAVRLVMADVDNDKRVDAVTWGRGGVRLYRNLGGPLSTTGVLLAPRNADCDEVVSVAAGNFDPAPGTDVLVSHRPYRLLVSTGLFDFLSCGSTLYRATAPGGTPVPQSLAEEDLRTDAAGFAIVRSRRVFAPVSDHPVTNDAVVAAGDLDRDGVSEAFLGLSSAFVVPGDQSGPTTAAILPGRILQSGSQTTMRYDRRGERVGPIFERGFGVAREAPALPLAVGDFDADRRSDAIALDGAQLRTARGAADGLREDGSVPAQHPGTSVYDVRALDVDNDGIDDLVQALNGSNKVLIHWGRGPSPSAPASFLMPTTVVGQRSATQTVTITNQGTRPWHPDSVGLADGDAGSFEIAGESCTGRAVQPQGSCTVSLVFAPVRNGFQATVLRVDSSVAGRRAETFVGGSGSPAPNATTLQSAETTASARDGAAAPAPAEATALTATPAAARTSAPAETTTIACAKRACTLRSAVVAGTVKAVASAVRGKRSVKLRTRLARRGRQVTVRLALPAGIERGRWRLRIVLRDARGRTVAVATRTVRIS